ncbi:MAG: F0F1 ATP synthase subunit A [Endomicrobium sp.]|jgi:F-type H+-transporting ATPase subunit a|nr:F0F1 ATP synthase subunit A [Endomicrobium sp.]
MKPDILFSIANFPITNTVIATIISDIIITIFIIKINKVISLKPCSLQNIAEMIINYFIEITNKLAGEKSLFISPWILSFFMFILISNLIAQFPGFESITFLKTSMQKNHCKVQILKSVSSDLNFTTAIAVISVVLTHHLSIKHIGIKSYVTKFVNFKIFPIFFFVGILEFLNEITKVISFSFRLFGNISSGEKIMTTMYEIFPFILPLPFILLEFLVAVVQATVFSLLTMVFMHIMTDKSI